LLFPLLADLRLNAHDAIAAVSLLPNRGDAQSAV